MKKLFFILLTVLAYSCGNAPEIELKFNPEEGKCYRYEQNSDIVTKQVMLGKNIQADLKMHTTCEMKVVTKTAEAATLQFTYCAIAYAMSNPMAKLEYDSKNPKENATEESNIMAKIFDSLIGHPFEVKVAPDGSVLSVTGFDIIVHAMLESLSDDGEMAVMIGEALAEQFNEESLRKQFEQSFKIYPAQAVKVGGKWNLDQPFSLGDGFDMDIKSIYTLKKVEGLVATVDIVSAIKMKESDSAGLNINFSGKQTGTVQMNTVSGLPEWSEITQKIEGSAIDITQSIDTKNRLSITEIE